MRKFTKYLFLFCLLAICPLLFGTIDGQAATLTNPQSIQHTTTLYQDITGDGQMDSIRIYADKKGIYFYDTLTVYVNGKLALRENLDYCSGVSTRFLSCSKKNNYLQLIASADGGYMYLNKLYSYSDGKLVTALNLGQEDNASATVTKVTRKSVTVKFSTQPWETGRVEWKYVYQPKGKKLKIKNKTAKVTSVIGSFTFSDGYSSYFKQNKFVAKKEIIFYTSTSMKKKAFTVKPGDVIKLQRVKGMGDHMYLSFKKGKKTGWQKVNGKYVYQGDWFYGVSNRLAG